MLFVFWLFDAWDLKVVSVWSIASHGRFKPGWIQSCWKVSQKVCFVLLEAFGEHSWFLDWTDWTDWSGSDSFRLLFVAPWWENGLSWLLWGDVTFATICRSRFCAEVFWMLWPWNQWNTPHLVKLVTNFGISRFGFLMFFQFLDLFLRPSPKVYHYRTKLTPHPQDSDGRLLGLLTVDIWLT